MSEKAKPFGLEINWDKTKIQAISLGDPPPASVFVLGNDVLIGGSFPYLGFQIHSSGSSDAEISRRIIIVRACMRFLDCGIWHSGISVTTKGEEKNTASLRFLTFIQVSSKLLWSHSLYQSYGGSLPGFKSCHRPTATGLDSTVIDSLSGKEPVPYQLRSLLGLETCS
ncbi:hypothetical protein HELRODRAFT_158512 [Helobdella robusta]|uniref:Reverse transcriptase domain-containing protein n=1 Tax=Helobdella robusta TaxID=6412 RepID=T1EMW0_HELRO|nr:hypothetical protein HELRODRAFT_158512 [Helobdella robusta]ESO12090.1 hypothetical protein HELRODRAFT_158512 [Helobdella robusta]